MIWFFLSDPDYFVGVMRGLGLMPKRGTLTKRLILLLLKEVNRELCRVYAPWHASVLFF
jgi:hypothetical protein